MYSYLISRKLLFVYVARYIQERTIVVFVILRMSNRFLTLAYNHLFRSQVPIINGFFMRTKKELNLALSFRELFTIRFFEIYKRYTIQTGHNKLWDKNITIQRKSQCYIKALICWKL